MSVAAPASLNASGRNRRTEQRLPIAIDVALTFRDGEASWTEVDSRLIDLSRRGMFVRSDRVPIDYQQIVLRIASRRRGLCAASGRPVRIAEWGGFGVRFERINRAFDDLIRELHELTPARRAAAITELSDAEIWIERR